MLTYQIDQQDRTLQQMQQDLKDERVRHQESTASLHQSKRLVAQLHDDNDALSLTHKETTAKLRESENKVTSLREELEVSQQCQRSLKEEVADRDGQLRVA